MWQQLLLIIKNIFEELSHDASLTSAFPALVAEQQHIRVVPRMEGVAEGGSTQHHKIRCTSSSRNPQEDIKEIEREPK